MIPENTPGKAMLCIVSCTVLVGNFPMMSLWFPHGVCLTPPLSQPLGTFATVRP